MKYQKTETERLKFEETQRQWREELCWQCARLQVNDFSPYCSDKCRRGAVIEADEEEGRQDKIKLWAKFINHQYAAWSALFELITGFKPPKMKEIAAIISGH